MDMVSLLRSEEQIDDFYEQNGDPAPYVLQCHNKDQLLVFIGSAYCNEPNDPQFDVIRHEWARFVEMTTSDRRMALTEGGIWPVEQDETTAIQLHGELGLLAFLADQARVSVATPEPPQSEEGDFLLQQFSAEEIMYYYFARQIPQWHRMTQRPDFRSYMQHTLDGYQAALGWNFDFSVDNMIGIHAQLFDRVFDEGDEEFFADQARFGNETPIQQVSQASVEFRDRHIARELLRYWNQGLSIFSVYGSHHAYVLEPMIRELDSNT